jgi:hypothetical protein
MEVAKPARRRPHPQGCNEVEDGQCRRFLERSVREEWRSQGKKLRQAQRRLLRLSGDGTANFHHERRRWVRGKPKETMVNRGNVAMHRLEK